MWRMTILHRKNFDDFCRSEFLKTHLGTQPKPWRMWWFKTVFLLTQNGQYACKYLKSFTKYDRYGDDAVRMLHRLSYLELLRYPVFRIVGGDPDNRYDEGWYAGTIPQDWQVRIDDKIKEKESK